MKREEGVNSMNKLWYVKMILSVSELVVYYCTEGTNTSNVLVWVMKHMQLIIFQNLKDTTQQLRGLAAIPEDQCSTSSTHTPAHNYCHSFNSGFRKSSSEKWPLLLKQIKISFCGFLVIQKPVWFYANT